MPEPRLPEIGEFVRGTGKLVSIEKAPPPPPPPSPSDDYIFEDITARSEIRRNGHVLKVLTTYNDFYGRETSVSTSIEQMKQYAAAHDVTAQSEVEIVVVRIATYCRRRPTSGENLYSKEFRSFAYVENGWGRDVPDEVETDVWSTRLGDIPATGKDVSNG